MVSDVRQCVMLDTNVLIFGVLNSSDRPVGTSPKETYAYWQGRLARHFLTDCFAKGIEVVVSSVSVSEAMEGIGGDDAALVREMLCELYPVVAFDRSAAFIAADYARSLRAQIENRVSDRTMLRNDLYILASGVTYGCTELYTTDSGLMKIAGRLNVPIKVLGLPEIND